MSTYLLTFEDFEKRARFIDSYKHQAVYWLSGDKIILECPMRNGEGAYAGITWRCELDSATMAEIMYSKNILRDLSLDDAKSIFLQILLADYLKVLGKLDEPVADSSSSIERVAQE